MDDRNPYSSPLAYTRPAGRPPMRFVAVFFIAVGLLIWFPMTIGAFVAAILEPEIELWSKLGAGSFNAFGSVAFTWLGFRLWRGTLPSSAPETAVERDSD